MPLRLCGNIRAAYDDGAAHFAAGLKVHPMTLRLTLAALAVSLGIATLPALADETVTVGGAQAALIKPSGAAKGSIILMAGGNGRLNIGPGGSIGSLQGNQLVRTRHAYAERGFAVTLGLGIITSFFTAVMVTRLIVIGWLNVRKPKKLTI